MAQLYSYMRYHRIHYRQVRTLLIVMAGTNDTSAIPIFGGLVGIIGALFGAFLCIMVPVSLRLLGRT